MAGVRQVGVFPEWVCLGGSGRGLVRPSWARRSRVRIGQAWRGRNGMDSARQFSVGFFPTMHGASRYRRARQERLGPSGSSQSWQGDARNVQAVQGSFGTVWNGMSAPGVARPGGAEHGTARWGRAGVARIVQALHVTSRRLVARPGLAKQEFQCKACFDLAWQERQVSQGQCEFWPGSAVFGRACCSTAWKGRSGTACSGRYWSGEVSPGES